MRHDIQTIVEEWEREREKDHEEKASGVLACAAWRLIRRNHRSPTHVNSIGNAIQEYIIHTVEA